MTHPRSRALSTSAATRLLSVHGPNELIEKGKKEAWRISLTLQLILIYVPFFNTVFRTTPLRPAELGICAVGALVIILITESKKLFLRSKQH